jgi:heme/copper-type cytochrome/quinol oxidase subunit 1
MRAEPPVTTSDPIAGRASAATATMAGWDEQAGRVAGEVVPPATRRLLTAWLALALGSLVVAGLFAILVAFARTPAVELLGTRADLFRLALVSHVTFAFTVWFITFVSALWVYAAWRANYRLDPAMSWTGFVVATAGSALMAVPAFTASGTPFLNDYIPIIDHPLFWAGLVGALAGVALQAVAYLDGWWGSRRDPGTSEPLEARALAVAALAMVLGVATLAVTWAALETNVAMKTQLRALVWGAGHLFQYVHTAGMVAVWAIVAAVALGSPLPSAKARGPLSAYVPFVLSIGAAYLVWSPEDLLSNRLVTWITFSGLGVPSTMLALLVLAAVVRARRERPGGLPWTSPLFGGLVVCFTLFGIGGVMGVIGFNQDTRVPAHYHGMVGAVTLAYMGLTPMLLELTGRRPWKPTLTKLQPYLYGVGLLGLMLGMHWAGGHGAPRKSLGFEWANAQALIAMNLMGLGSLLAIAGGLAFVLNMGIPLLGRGDRAGAPASAAQAPDHALTSGASR